MIRTKDTATIEPIRGVRAGNTVARISSRLGNLTPINLLLPTLDDRVTYTGPAHYYWDVSGIIKQSTANVWPLEYRDGVAVGRHEPEPAITNWQVNNRGEALNANVLAYGDFTLTTNPTGGPDGGAIGQFPYPQFGNYAITQDINSVELWPRTPYVNSKKWTRYAMQASNTASSRCRIRYGYPDAPAVEPYVYYAQSGNLAIRDWVWSWFGRVSDDGQSMLAGFAQIERENTPFATSPVLNPGTSFNQRAASSVSVAKQSGATGIVVYFTDGTNKAYSFNNATSVTLLMAGAHWSQRYISRIEYR
jgi:hypothetical protein